MSIFSNDPYVCNCDCHSSDPMMKVQHIMACCRTCGICKKRIKTGHWDAHQEKDHPKNDCHEMQFYPY